MPEKRLERTRQNYRPHGVAPEVSAALELLAGLPHEEPHLRNCMRCFARGRLCWADEFPPVYDGPA